MIWYDRFLSNISVRQVLLLFGHHTFTVSTGTEQSVLKGSQERDWGIDLHGRNILLLSWLSSSRSKFET